MYSINCICYIWFKYNLGLKYYAPQVRPDQGSNSWPPDHDSIFNVTETPALTTWPSVTIQKHCTSYTCLYWGHSYANLWKHCCSTFSHVTQLQRDNTTEGKQKYVHVFCRLSRRWSNAFFVYIDGDNLFYNVSNILNSAFLNHPVHTYL